MTVTDLRPVGAIPAGWYPDPVDSAGLRWWSGEDWTEHTTAPPPIVLAAPVTFSVPTHVEPSSAGPGEAGPAVVQRASRMPPRRTSGIFSGVALGFAVLGLLALVAGQLLEFPDLVLYLAAAVPFTFAVIAIVVAVRTGRARMIAVMAAMLCILNAGMVVALNALDARSDVGTTPQNTATFEQVLEQSVVQAANNQGLSGAAIAADCPNVPTPAKGTVVDCTVTFDSGEMYLVHVTSKDGLGGMAFELVPVAIGSATSAG